MSGAGAAKKWLGPIVLAAFATFAFVWSWLLGDCKTYSRYIYANDDDCARDYAGGLCGRAVGAEERPMIVGPWFVSDRKDAPEGDAGPGSSAAAGRSTIATAIETELRRRGFGWNTTSACS